MKTYKRKGVLFIFTIRNNSSSYLDKHHLVFDSFLLVFFLIFFAMIGGSSDSFWLFFMIDLSPFSRFSLSPSLLVLLKDFLPALHMDAPLFFSSLFRRLFLLPLSVHQIIIKKRERTEYWLSFSLFQKMM